MIKPKLSVVVIFHNMSREAARTLRTLGTDYQRDVSATDYEVIAIDNGSSEPLLDDQIGQLGPNFSYHFYETESVSPVGAINFGCEQAQGDLVGIIVDGARMVTPGLIQQSLRASKIAPRPFICALAWHLGPDVQNITIADGYDQAVEDRLLDSIDWRNDGYRLFEISSLAQSSDVGLYGGLPNECSWLVISRSDFFDLGGFDARFQSPGGGLVNQDFLKRALKLDGISPIVLVEEGSFHQFHGGVATNCKTDKHPIVEFQSEYRRIHGRSWKNTNMMKPLYFGQVRENCQRFESRNLVGKSGLSNILSRTFNRIFRPVINIIRNHRSL